MHELPIDRHLPLILETVRTQNRLVLGAPPGAGKTTRVPKILRSLAHGKCRKVLVLEPRRLAAKMAAKFVARELNEGVGQSVGYQVRFDRAVGPATNIVYMTEALLLRELHSDPLLSEVHTVIFDEFHERHIASDVALAFVRNLRDTARSDLNIVCMSATLDVAEVAKRLGNWATVETTGRSFPVEIEYQKQLDDRPLALQVSRAVRQAVAQSGDGHLLVFLPGAAEIFAAIKESESWARECDVSLLPLFGQLDSQAQERAFEDIGRRKIIFATNVAETSVTIDGVSAVVDTGLARISSVNPWSGISALRVMPISRASADQRAGRAGRTRPGHCFRLYTRHDFEQRRPFETPEILRADLSETTLLLLGLNQANPEALPWLDAPNANGWAAAFSLLSLLGAVDAHRKLTPIGRAMLKYPLHPRLARIVEEARRREVVDDAALAAALLAERGIEIASQRKATVAQSSDLEKLIDLYREAEQEGFRASSVSRLGLNFSALQDVRGSYRQILDFAEKKSSRSVNSENPKKANPEALHLAVLSGFPDRIALAKVGADQRRGEIEYVFATGGRAKLAPSSVVKNASLLAAVDIEDRKDQKSAGNALIRLAFQIDELWLLELWPDLVAEEVSWLWRTEAKRVETVRQTRFMSLVLEENRVADPDPEKTADLLFSQAKTNRAAPFYDPEIRERFVARMELLAAFLPEAKDFLATDWEMNALKAACAGLRSFDALRELDWAKIWQSQVSSNLRSALDQQTPDSIKLPSGKKLPVHYSKGKPPFVESYLQDFSKMSRCPTCCDGRVTMVVHLWAPSRRPLQVTSDLASFWQTHYPKLKNQLMRRYPKHHWP